MIEAAIAGISLFGFMLFIIGTVVCVGIAVAVVGNCAESWSQESWGKRAMGIAGLFVALLSATVCAGLCGICGHLLVP